jgi:hypothetical protein
MHIPIIFHFQLLQLLFNLADLNSRLPMLDLKISVLADLRTSRLLGRYDISGYD